MQSPPRKGVSAKIHTVFRPSAWGLSACCAAAVLITPVHAQGMTAAETFNYLWGSTRRPPPLPPGYSPDDLQKRRPTPAPATPELDASIAEQMRLNHSIQQRQRDDQMRDMQEQIARERQERLRDAEEQTRKQQEMFQDLDLQASRLRALQP